MTTSAVFEKCAICGGVLGAFRVVIAGETVHPRCSHDARDHRIAELEALLRRIDAVVTWETTPLGRHFQEEVEAALRR